MVTVPVSTVLIRNMVVKYTDNLLGQIYARSLTLPNSIVALNAFTLASKKYHGLALLG